MKRTTTALVIACGLLAAGCGKGKDKEQAPAKPAAQKEAPPPAKAEAKPEATPPRTAVATLEAKNDSGVSGTVTFTESDGKVAIVAEIAGLSAGDHGFHVHEKGDCSAADGTSAGGHFNPHGADHGAPGAEVKHTGDLGNVTAGEDGTAKHELSADWLTLGEGEHSIAGLAVILHEKADDFGQPTGNAGGRVACGVIELK